MSLGLENQTATHSSQTAPRRWQGRWAARATALLLIALVCHSASREESLCFAAISRFYRIPGVQASAGADIPACLRVAVEGCAASAPIASPSADPRDLHASWASSGCRARSRHGRQTGPLHFPNSRRLRFAGRHLPGPVDVPWLVKLGKKSGGVIELVPAVGDTVLELTPFLNVYGATRWIDEKELRKGIEMGEERTFEQDPKYAIRLLVDIGIKALSPAINDPTTAVQALDQIGASTDGSAPSRDWQVL